MPIKTYEQLSPEKQQVIDAAILHTEAFRIIESKKFDDERDCFFSDPKLLVNYLRGLYALDMGTNPPLYFNWRSQGPAIIHSALEIQKVYSPAANVDSATAAFYEFTVGAENIKHLKGLLEHLTNLPKPEEKSKDRGRLH